MYSYLNIIIPVYNEGDNILRTFRKIEEDVPIPHEIRVVYDFEEDTTVPVVQDYLSRLENAEKKIHLVRNSYGRGALNAIKTGFDSVSEGVILVVMADLSDDLAIVGDMFGKINQGCDIVCGSRYMRGGKQIGGPRFKKFLSRAAGLSLYYLAGIPTHDVTNSFKMYTKRVLQDIQIESDGGFELGMEIVIKAHSKGYKIDEVPSVWRDREAGKSNFKLWKWLPKYLHWYWLSLKGKVTARRS